MRVGLVQALRRRRSQAQRQRRQEDAGFTLLEILVVITILGILVAVVSPAVLGRVDQAKQTKALIEIRQFADALERYAIDNGDYPTSEEGLQALAIQPDNATSWNGPYLTGVLKPDGTLKNDPWGNPYIYVYPGTHSDIGYAFDITSYGKDGREGGTGRYDADITNWGGVATSQ